MTEEVSYSVAGANLRKRRRRDDTSANVRKRRRNEVPSVVDTADLSRCFPGKIKKKEYREYSVFYKSSNLTDYVFEFC